MSLKNYDLDEIERLRVEQQQKLELLEKRYQAIFCGQTIQAMVAAGRRGPNCTNPSQDCLRRQPDFRTSPLEFVLPPAKTDT